MIAQAASSALTVADVVTLYLRHSRATGLHGPEALEERDRTLTAFASALGALPVGACRPYHLADWVEGNARWKSVSTRRAKANQVRAAFAWALEQERIDRNPFLRVRYAEAERRPELPDEVLQVVQRLANKPFERALRFLRLTGCRLSELCRACWADLDLDKGLWVIPRHKSRRYTNKPKVVALVAEAVALLRGVAEAGAARAGAMESHEAQARGALAAAAGARDGPVFLNTRGKPWTRRTLGQQLARMKKRHGIRTPATLHGIRHRMATACVEAGAPLKLVAQQLGHSTTAVTERYYVNIGREQVEAIRQAAQLGAPH